MLATCMKAAFSFLFSRTCKRPALSQMSFSKVEEADWNLRILKSLKHYIKSMICLISYSICAILIDSLS